MTPGSMLERHFNTQLVLFVSEPKSRFHKGLWFSLKTLLLLLELDESLVQDLQTFWLSGTSETIMPISIKYLPYCSQCRWQCLCFPINRIWHNSESKLRILFIFQILHNILSFSARVWRWFQNYVMKNRGGQDL